MANRRQSRVETTIGDSRPRRKHRQSSPVRYYGREPRPGSSASQRIPHRPRPQPEFDDDLSQQLETSEDNGQDEESDYESVDQRMVPHSRPSQRQPLRIVDWRGEMCRLLGLETTTTDDNVLEELAKTELILQEESQRARSEAFELEELPPRGQVIYRISCHESRMREELYLEEPWISRSGPYGSHLRAGDSIRNFELFLERGKDISFIIFKDFECCGRPRNSMKGIYDDPSSPIASHFLTEQISIVSRDLSAALVVLSTGALKGIRHPRFELGTSRDQIAYPYLWWFHRREEINQAQQQLGRQGEEQLGVFSEYLQHRLGKDWDAVDKLISEGKINSQYIEYLFVPDTVVISKSDGDEPTRIRGAVADGWLFAWRDYPEQSDARQTKAVAPMASLECLQWSFDGNFQCDLRTLRIKNLPAELHKEIDITALDVYPSRFAEPETLEAILNRGKMFWKCRQRRYVCYNESMEDTMQVAAAQRFMVDITIYKEIHPQDSQSPPKRDDLAAHDTSQDEPPLGDDFLLCLPTTIPGFNMQKKEWVTLDVGSIKDVQWNRDAFEMLVADEETKELVRALVENHCNAEKNTDLISGKGNGLFVLLHGAPGTGKTLTAETVAEIAEKPLYRVTCGDIGTKAEDVEKYLETVLLLGKTWGCVVLLDEADVFLEERTLFDLQRNALVSVFLRVLEYYEGILILTSNRVGIFDEAFKSRIQLTLRYKNLEEPQRKKIWENLIKRLQAHQNNRPHTPKAQNSRGASEHEIDFTDILAHLDELAKVELNGRQIRNAVSTARQLAMFRKKSMQFSHLKVVINESEKFDAYLKEVTGLSADIIQRDKGNR